MKKLLLTLFLVLCAASVSAQEAPKPSEVFRWFPQVKFKEMTWFNRELASREPGFKTYCSFKRTSPAMLGRLFPLPESLQDRWLSSASVLSVKYKVTREKGVTNVRWEAGLAGANNVEGTMYKAFSVGHLMQVICFPLELNLKKLLLAQQQVKATDSSFFMMPVYHYQADHGERYKKSYYFFISNENQIVACEDLELLSLMANAANAEHAPLAEDFPFPFFWERIPSLGNYWYMGHHVASNKALIQAFEKDGVDNAEIDKQRKAIENPRIYGSNTVFAKEPVIRSWDLRSTPEYAGKQYKITKGGWHKPDPRVHRGKSGDYQYMNTQLSLEENMIVRTTILTPEYMEGYQKRREEEKKEREASKTNQEEK